MERLEKKSMNTYLIHSRRRWNQISSFRTSETQSLSRVLVRLFSQNYKNVFLQTSMPADIQTFKIFQTYIRISGMEVDILTERLNAKTKL